MIFIIIPLLILFILGAIITYEDFKFSKIRNKWIKLGFILGLVHYFILLFLTGLGYLNILPLLFEINYFAFVLLNTVIAFVLAFGIWYLKLWAGGDAKLFTLYVFLIPLSFYGNAYFKYWPALNLLINMMLPILIYLLVKMLIYPIQAGVNYLKDPQLIKEYYLQFKEKKQIDKTKVKEYIATAISFLLILIFFQLFRTHLMDFLTPYLGNLITISYFFIGFFLLKPLRKLLQTQVILVSLLIVTYFTVSLIYFPQNLAADFYKIFAWQFVFMLSFFYILKYGRILGQYLYDSTEIKVLALEGLQAGVYINKSYIKQIMGSRLKMDEFNEQVTIKLDEEDKKNLQTVIKNIQEKAIQKEMKLIAIARSVLRPNSWPRLYKQVKDLRQTKQNETAIIEKLKAKFTDDEKVMFDIILQHSDEIDQFLKSIKGKLTEPQASQLKQMIEARNQEVIAQGKDPIKHIILHKTFSFAPFMLLGVIITLLTKSNLIHLVYQWLGR